MKNNNGKSIVKGVFVLCSLFSVLETNAQQLETLIEEALANNPEIQKFELLHDIASEKVNEANTLPNTLVSFSHFVSEPETRTGAQKARVSISQMLPWFGSITARENYAMSLADTKY